MATELKCPNCGSPAAAAEAGKKIVCTSCGGSFVFEQGEAKLAGVGEIDQIKADVEELKKRLPASTPAADPVEDPQPDPDQDEEEPEDEDDL